MKETDTNVCVCLNRAKVALKSGNLFGKCANLSGLNRAKVALKLINEKIKKKIKKV